MKVGSVLGHYHVIRTLGRGGMGAVYEASDTRLNRQVARVGVAGDGYVGPPRRCVTHRRRRGALHLASCGRNQTRHTFTMAC